MTGCRSNKENSPQPLSASGFSAAQMKAQWEVSVENTCWSSCWFSEEDMRLFLLPAVAQGGPCWEVTFTFLSFAFPFFPSLRHCVLYMSLIFFKASFTQSEKSTRWSKRCLHNVIFLLPFHFASPQGVWAIFTRLNPWLCSFNRTWSFEIQWQSTRNVYQTISQRL